MVAYILFMYMYMHVGLKTFVRVSRCQYRGTLTSTTWTGLDPGIAQRTDERQNHHYPQAKRNKMNLQ